MGPGGMPPTISLDEDIRHFFLPCSVSKRPIYFQPALASADPYPAELPSREESNRPGSVLACMHRAHTSKHQQIMAPVCLPIMSSGIKKKNQNNKTPHQCKLHPIWRGVVVYGENKTCISWKAFTGNQMAGLHHNRI